MESVSPSRHQYGHRQEATPTSQTAVTATTTISVTASTASSTDVASMSNRRRPLDENVRTGHTAV